MTKPSVLLGIPDYDGKWRKETALAGWQHGSTCDMRTITASSSLLGHTMNQLWCKAILSHQAGEVDYFCMLHADIAPEADWLDKMMAEMQRSGAHVLSAVSPIKDGSGNTSMGTMTGGCAWYVDKLTLNEIEKLPPTFDIDDVRRALPRRAGHDDVLLVNTGLLLVDLRSGWGMRRDEHGMLETFFTIADRVVASERPDNGGTHLQVEVLPEDWRFSIMAHEAGQKVMATSAVKLIHIGGFGFNNFIVRQQPTAA